MTTTEDPYVRVEREDLAVGMRFDYRLPDEPWDTVERTLTALDPIAYDSGNVGHVTLNPDDDITSEHEFYVHRDDITLVPTRVPVEQARVGEQIALDVPGGRDAVMRGNRTWLGVDARGHVEFEDRGNAGESIGTYTHVWVLRPTRPEPAPDPAETAPEAASSVEERVDQERAEARAEQVAHAATAGYEEGLRDGYANGYAKAQAEQVTEARTKPRRKRFTREDAVVLAIQAVGGGEHAMSVVSVASSIEQYVNGSDEAEQPAGPLDAAALGALPIGSIVRDRDGDYWRKTEPSASGACWAIGGRGPTEAFRTHPGRSSGSLASAYSPLHFATASEAGA